MVPKRMTMAEHRRQVRVKDLEPWYVRRSAPVSHWFVAHSGRGDRSLCDRVELSEHSVRSTMITAPRCQHCEHVIATAPDEQWSRWYAR